MPDIFAHLQYIEQRGWVILNDGRALDLTDKTEIIKSVDGVERERINGLEMT